MITNEKQLVDLRFNQRRQLAALLSSGQVVAPDQIRGSEAPEVDDAGISEVSIRQIASEILEDYSEIVDFEVARFERRVVQDVLRGTDRSVPLSWAEDAVQRHVEASPLSSRSEWAERADDRKRSISGACVLLVMADKLS